MFAFWDRKILVWHIQVDLHHPWLKRTVYHLILLDADVILNREMIVVIDHNRAEKSIHWLYGLNVSWCEKNWQLSMLYVII